MKRTLLSLLGGICLVAGMSGCTATVRPSDVQANFSGMLMMADNAQRDYQARLTLYQTAVNMSGQASLNPYPDMRAQLAQMQPVIGRIKAESQRLQGYKSQFDALFVSKSEITSKDPDWDKYQTVSIQFNQRRQPLNELWGEYQQAAGAFQQDVNHFMIGPMSLEDANHRLNAVIARVQGPLDRFKPQVEAAAGKVDFLKGQDAPYSVVEQKVKALMACKDAISDLYHVREQLKPEVDDLGSYLDSQQPREVWVGPGIPHTSVLVDAHVLEPRIHDDEKTLDAALQAFAPPAQPQPQAAPAQGGGSH